MKRNFALLTLCFLFALNSSAQRDTVYVDRFDYEYDSLPSRYRVIDTTLGATRQRVTIGSQAGCAGNALVNTSIVGPRDTSFYFWELEMQSGSLNGKYYFTKDSILKDSIILNTNSPTIQFTDTFKTYDSLLSLGQVCSASGNGFHAVKTHVFHKRVVINIRPKSAAGDTVYVDQNDSVYYDLPNAYQTIDTTIGIVDKGIFTTGGSPTSGGVSMRSGRLPDTTFFVYLKVDAPNSNTAVTYFFGHGTNPLDTLNINANSAQIQFTDTFKINGDSILTYFTRNGNGVGTVTESLVAYFTRTEINIQPISIGLLKTNANKELFSIYPNPVTQSLYLSSEKQLQNQLIEIYDMGGRLILRKRLSEKELNLRSLTKGLYILALPESSFHIKFQKL